MIVVSNANKSRTRCILGDPGAVSGGGGGGGGGGGEEKSKQEKNVLHVYLNAAP